MKEDAINDNVDRKFTEEFKIKFVKIEEPETVEEIFKLDNVEKRRDKDSIKESEEKKMIGEYKMERSKGGGEYRARIHQDFMHATEERGSMANLEESSMHT